MRRPRMAGPPPARARRRHPERSRTASTKGSEGSTAATATGPRRRTSSSVSAPGPHPTSSTRCSPPAPAKSANRGASGTGVAAHEAVVGPCGDREGHARNLRDDVTPPSRLPLIGVFRCCRTRDARSGRSASKRRRPACVACAFPGARRARTVPGRRACGGRQRRRAAAQLREYPGGSTTSSTSRSTGTASPPIIGVCSRRSARSRRTAAR